MFNPAIKVSDVPQKEKKALPVSEGKEDLSFKLFEQAEKEAPPEKGWNKQHSEIHCEALRIHCFMLKSQMLHSGRRCCFN